MCITDYDKEHIATLFREEGREKGYVEGLKEGGILILKNLVKDEAISLSDAPKPPGCPFRSFSLIP